MDVQTKRATRPFSKEYKWAGTRFPRIAKRRFSHLSAR
jgi:hypothetical protein